jgi:hypothetical protein
MTEEEIREIVRQTVRATLRELFFDDYPRRHLYREREAVDEFGLQVNKLGFLVSDIEKKWSSAPKCLYDKGVITAIKSDTSKIP